MLYCICLTLEREKEMQKAPSELAEKYPMPLKCAMGLD